MLPLILALLAAVNLVAGLGLPNPLIFEQSADALTLASVSTAIPILYDSSDPEAVRIAVTTFAEDVFRVAGVKPDVYADALPSGTRTAIVVGTVHSALLQRVRLQASRGHTVDANSRQVPLDVPESLLAGQWEAFDARVLSHPLEGLDKALVITGSDRVRTQLYDSRK